jgi:hypothetical protein
MENNKLIAEFMSGEHPLAEVTHEAHHNYDTSWDWLMPVIHRIRDHVNVDMGFEEYDDWRENFKQIDPYNYSLEQCYKAVVEFIKQYDNQRNAHS